jgi:hypothetical protein
MDYTDSIVCHYYLQLTAHISDILEQSLSSSVFGGFCSVCVVPKKNFQNQPTK